MKLYTSAGFDEYRPDRPIKVSKFTKLFHMVSDLLTSPKMALVYILAIFTLMLIVGAWADNLFNGI
jgi:hypothetical protein